MNIKFVGEPFYDGSTNTLQVEASVEEQPIRCVVSAEALQALSDEQTTSVNVAQIFRLRQDLFRSIIIERLQRARDQRPDSIVIKTAEVSGRRL